MKAWAIIDNYGKPWRVSERYRIYNSREVAEHIRDIDPIVKPFKVKEIEIRIIK